MRTLTYQLRDLKKVNIEIGFEGENNRTQVRIDCGELFAEYPNAEAALKVQAPKGGIYPATVTRDGDMILWTVRDCDVANKGNGEFQLTFTDGDTVVKTCPGKIHIDRSLKGSGTAPSGVQDWLDRAEEALEGVEAAEIHQPMIGLDGYWYTWDQENEEYVKTNTKAQGSGADLIDDTTPASDKVFSSEKVNTELNTVKSDLLPFPKTAAAGDVGKYLKVKTVENGKPKEYEYGTPSGGDVTDVKVNNVSVLDGTVAKIPLASSSAPGVVKVNAGGLQMVGDTIKIIKAQDSVVKDGTVETAPIVPSNQHLAAFYGLAKAANDTSQASSANAVGSYTDDALVKIQKMLGVYQSPWELIREDTVTNATEADVDITVDGDGNAFELTDVYLQAWTPQQETAASIGDYGSVRCFYNDNNSIGTQMGTWTQPANTSAKYGQVLLTNENGAIRNEATQNATQYTLVNLTSRTNIISDDALLKIGTYSFKKITIKKVTGTMKYKLYGRRKWN